MIFSTAGWGFLGSALLLSIVLWAYLYIAGRKDILDVPNERSSHKERTIRGAGVVFIAAAVLGFFYSGYASPVLFISLFLGGITGFLDDRFTLGAGLRLLLYGLCAAGITYQIVSGHESLGIWINILLFVFILGTMNTVNFMDGINGITTLYLLVLIASLMQFPLNAVHYAVEYTDMITLALILFALLNVRKKAVCFMGDSGSIVLGLYAAFLVYDVAYNSGRIVYLLLLAVYGVDSLGTILIRLLNKENITTAHRSHAYQLLSNEAGLGHVRVSMLYAALQLMVNYLLYIWVIAHWDVRILIPAVLITLSILYLFVKFKYQRDSLRLWKV
ncbi:MAG: UDP-GlcNAc--UDP-phosphate GlcNAc-1-phosphate transferase [Flavobacteriales bacterium]|nr:UDP-GlcNAc--UDP-phosphate GlcNAc-1-phosphate transferase [Flavobacteriales bacterium]